MSSESFMLVDVYFDHSIQHASAFISSSYPAALRDVIEMKSKRPFVPSHVLIEMQLPSTPLLTIRRVLQEHHGIPISVQYRFKQGRERSEPATLDLDDDTTLEEVWLAEEPVNRKAGEVILVLQTTAGRLSEIDRGSWGIAGLSSEIRLWRHYLSALRYLEKKLEVSERNRRKKLDEEIKRYQELRSLSEREMNNLLQDWDRLVGCFDPVDISPGNKVDEAGNHNFESQFDRWNQQLKRGLQETKFPYTTPRTQVGGLFANRESDGFVISSGILLWGQLHSVLAASLDQGFRGNAETVPEMLPGGTIMRYPLKYRSAARVGNWKVRKAFSQPYYDSVGEPSRHFGWVVYHEDVDPLEAVRRCSRITGARGISLGNRHVDKDVLYVNRYDWSYTSNPGATIPNFDALLARYTDLSADETEQADSLAGAHMLALDASHLSPAIGSLLVQDGVIGGGERILRGEGEEGFGALLSMPGTEYELGWLVFSGRKHEVFPEADELVAIVYDGAYDGLEGHKFRVEG